MTTYVDRQLRMVANTTEAHQNLFAQQQAQARKSLYAPHMRDATTPINYQACDQPWERLFAEKLGETEDFQAACKAASCTKEQGKRALRNPHTCAIAEAEHRKACQKLLDTLTVQMELAEVISQRSAKALRTERFATKREANHAFGVAYDDEKRFKDIRSLRQRLELRKERGAWWFQNSKWQTER